MKISSSQRNLLSIFALCVLAFWGFGSIFSDLNLSISAEISTAAFGALFIILTTKFLMEQENDAKRKEFIFQQNVNQYMKYAELQMKSIEGGKITEKEINDIKLFHANLLITGSDGAIKHSNDFLTKVIEAFHENKGQSIREDRRNELVECTARFLLAARSGLYLPNDHIDAKEQINSFLISENRARKALRIEENRNYEKLSDQGKENTTRLFQKISEWGYHLKHTKSQVSVYPSQDLKQGTVVCYIETTNDGFSIKSFDTKKVEALVSVAQNFTDLNARTIMGRKDRPDERKITLAFNNSLLNDEEKLKRLHQIINSLQELREK